jgi:hypothetical protein
MGWEIDHTKKERCPCGKSTVSTIYESDDWQHSRETTKIDCATCVTKFCLVYHRQRKPGLGTVFTLEPIDFESKKT